MKMKNIKHFIQAVFLFNLSLFLFCLIGCEVDYTIKPFYEGIFEGRNESISAFIQTEASEEQDSFSMFKEVMIKGNMERTLTARNPKGNNYTLFLPTDEAFEKFIEQSNTFNSFDDLLNDSTFVSTLVRYHVVNIAVGRNDFPFGALPDTTLTGDNLTINYTGPVDSTIIKVNNLASVIISNIELTNGFVHVIDEVLTPVVFNSYEWIAEKPEYSIFVEALEITGLQDTFDAIGMVDGKLRYPAITLMVESNELFSQNGINSIEDLKKEYSPGSQQYTEYTNGLYQFVAYHIMEGREFLNDFEGEESNINTYASAPISIDGRGIDIKINEGVEVFDTLVSQNDTTFIDFVKIQYDISNVLTKNGAIHFIDQVMDVYTPKIVERRFQFYEEPMISRASENPNEYLFDDVEEFSVLTWSGVEELTYVKSSSGLDQIWNNDYIEVDGNFTITYEIPKILPGKYLFQIRTNEDDRDNATIQIFLDGKKIGRNIDLSSDPISWSSVWYFDVGQVNFQNYEGHTLTIKALIEGKLTWDGVRFTPISQL